MKLLLTLVVVVVSAVIIYFFVLGYLSKKSHPLGLVDTQLAVCIKKPNCVCSEYSEDAAHFIQPIDLNSEGVRVNLSPVDVMSTVKEVIAEAGGKILEDHQPQQSSLYLAATFQSSLFGFIDDVEARLDVKNNHLHFRSASRVGHSDLGVNRKRVKHLSDVIMSRLQ